MKMAISSVTRLPAGWILLSSILAVLAAHEARASWPQDPAVNLPVCLAPYNQTNVVAAPDGQGGAIFAWLDARSMNHHDVYAQHVLRSGDVDPLWPVDGRALCTAPTYKGQPVIVSDGAGGAIVAWTDSRHFDVYRPYAQHVRNDGGVDPNWPVDGLALSDATVLGLNPSIVSDGAGGAILAWEDGFYGSYDIYSQRVLASGVIAPGWNVRGQCLCNAVNDQEFPKIASDGAGGALVTWEDRREPDYRIYAQRVTGSGVAVWTPNGVPACSAPGSQTFPSIDSDGAGGAMIAWNDYRSGTTFDVYAQHLLNDGAVDSACPADGIPISTGPDDTGWISVLSDGFGGAIIGWTGGTFVNGRHPFIQHVQATGVIDPAWPAAGVPMGGASPNNPIFLTDGNHGAMAVWQEKDEGYGYADILAQRVLANGVIDPRWPATGRWMSNAPGDQLTPTAIPCGDGGVIGAWEDHRSGGGADDRDIEAQRIGPDGVLGITEPTAVGSSSAERLTLDPPLPSPAVDQITVRFAVESPISGRLDVFDAAGRRVRTLVRTHITSGAHFVHWDLRDDRGRRVGPGQYFLSLRVVDASRTRRLVVAR